MAGRGTWDPSTSANSHILSPWCLNVPRLPFTQASDTLSLFGHLGVVAGRAAVLGPRHRSIAQIAAAARQEGFARGKWLCPGSQAGSGWQMRGRRSHVEMNPELVALVKK